MKPINTKLVALYFECRKRKPFMLVGQDAKCSLATAKTILRFRELEAVRLRKEEEQENYFDTYGKPEGYTNAQGHWVSEAQATKDLEEMLDRYGLWWTCSEWFNGEEWQQADSCGMHSGYKNPLDPFENCYIVDEMFSAITALESHQAQIAFESSESFRAACSDIVTV
jgi:hypothetical protein